MVQRMGQRPRELGVLTGGIIIILMIIIINILNTDGAMPYNDNNNNNDLNTVGATAAGARSFDGCDKLASP